MDFARDRVVVIIVVSEKLIVKVVPFLKNSIKDIMPSFK
jgi:hypothetical protein